MNKPAPIYSSAEMRAIERLAAALPDAPAPPARQGAKRNQGREAELWRAPRERATSSLTSPRTLMEKAGLAVATVAGDKLLSSDGDKVLVLAGPGNNGGDAFVAARHLQAWWFKVTLVFTGERSRLSEDATQALDAWLAAGGEIVSEIPADKKWDAVIDGLFGIGLERDLQGKYLELVQAVNRLHLPVLALDIPSGLGSDNGKVYGAAIRAAITVTFIALKPGLLTHHGAEYCGEILLRDLDLDASSLLAPHCWRLDQAYAQKLLPLPRPADSHKGMFGGVGIIGGAAGMVGAAFLAGTAALKLGAGRVYLGLIAANAPSVNPVQPELMLRPVHELLKLEQLNCLVAGPGLGMEADAHLSLGSALESALPLVLDADALNLLAADSRLADLLRNRPAATILTPHAAEAARLLGTDTATIQNDRMAAAAKLAERYHCCAVLKGAGSICALPDGKRYINTSGNPGLSSAGSGDVLSGIIGAFLSQGLSAENALLLAVHLHGAAADALLQQRGGPVGMTASEIIDAARNLLNRWLGGQEKPQTH